MDLVKNISQDPIQQHTLIFEKYNIVIKLKFLSMVEIWTMDLTIDGNVFLGVKLSLGVLHFRQFNIAIDFVILDNSKEGIDPFKLDDFSIERISLYLVTPQELLEVRGFNVD